ncbi:hypothetical protein WMF37_17965 [Sorangium sp. So ce291]|uniref:hypothetical protein n=1 Tax=Sorangium sp. So ce291 TaxID=3133294 RepID=UPI003F61C17D
MQRPLLCNIVFASLLLGAPALAAEPTRRVLRMHYSEDVPAASCPGEAALREQIQLRTGYDPFREDAPEEVAVAIGPRGDALVATVKYRDAGGKVSTQREFDVPNSDAACDLLTSYVALSIAFTLTPFGLDGRAPAAAPPRPAAPPPEPPEPPRRAPPRRPEPASAPGRPWKTMLAGVGALARIGAGSDLLGGLSCIVRARWSRRLTVSLESRYVSLPPAIGARKASAGSAPDTSAPGGSSKARTLYTRALLSGALASCLHTSDLFVTCGLAEAGTLLLTTQPDSNPDTALLMMALGLRGGIELALDDTLWFYTHTEILAAFRLEDAPTIGALRTPHLTASVGAGLLAAF